ncbi:MAG: protease modulator HflC [Acidobacteriota bacterium]
MARTAAGFAGIIIAIIVISAAYVVPEGEQVVITRFGEPIGEPITEPGLKFRVPFVDTVRRFEKRFLEWDGKVTEIPTKEKRNILVDTYARWRITDPLVFLKRFQVESRAQARLSGILNGETRDAVARHDLAELIRTTDREEVRDESLLGDEAGSGLEPIQIGREAIRQEILRNAQQRVKDFGIEILDVQFKRINYVEEVRTSVYERMIAERRRIADRFRSEGEGEASRIRGDKERELKRIQSEAYREAREIIGEADAEAAEIYAQAYNQSADSRSFYEFLKTMESYDATFDQDTWVVLSTQGDFFKFLVSGDGK